MRTLRRARRPLLALLALVVALALGYGARALDGDSAGGAGKARPPAGSASSGAVGR